MATTISLIPLLMIAIASIIGGNIIILLASFIIATIVYIFDWVVFYLYQGLKKWAWLNKLVTHLNQELKLFAWLFKHISHFCRRLKGLTWSYLFNRTRIFLGKIELFFCFALPSTKTIIKIEQAKSRRAEHPQHRFKKFLRKIIHK